MNLIDRFRYIMKLNQLSASAFADKIDVQRSSVSHVLSGRNKPSLEFIQKVLRNFPRVDANWLINGSTKGAADKLVSADNTPSKIEDEKQVRAQTLATNLEPEQEVKTKPKEIQRILVFYNDNTFEEFKP